MSKNNSRKLKVSNGGVFGEIGLRAKLILKLFLDPRVSFWLKVLPVGSLIYLVNPFDIPGPLDDIAVVSLGFYLFVEMCPPAIVQEHMRSLHSVIDSTAVDPQIDDEVVDAEFHETSPEDSPSKKQ
jgi:uncharacterized membrane protein YkvA (DUF1232 family)